jgi:hypothetical protein
VGDNLRITPSAVSGAGAALSAAAEDAATAGSGFLAAGAAVTGQPPCGSSIAASAAAFGEAFGVVCADLIESAQGLGALVAQTVQTYPTVDSGAAGRFTGLRAI